jgi:hypothetical protein
MQGFPPKVRSAFTALSLMSLPFIKGEWIFVDPTSGNNGRSGDSVKNAVADLKTAYNLALDGDGIVLLSSGNTSAATTSYLTAELAWVKDGITLVGIAAPVSMYGRARVANKTVTTGALTDLAFTRGTGAVYDKITRETGSFITDGFVVGQKLRVVTTGTGANATGLIVTAVAALTLTLATIGTLVTETKGDAGSSVVSTYCVNLITVTGANNRFLNTMFWNGGTDALEIGGVVNTGPRNYFGNCHIVGGAGAATAATKYSLKADASQEGTFEKCVIGSDTFDHGNNADCEVLLNGKVARMRFEECEFLSFVSTGTAHGAVKSIGTSGGSPTLFKKCLFNSLLSPVTPAAAFLTSGACDKIGAPDSELLNFTAWGAGVYVASPAAAASAGGGIATVA